MPASRRHDFENILRDSESAFSLAEAQIPNRATFPETVDFTELHSLAMQYQEMIVLIPSHSLEDFPVDLGEDDAAGLLNAFAVLWHPRLLAECQALPSWHRADEPPTYLENRLVIVPHCCQDWLVGGWADHARSAGATVVDGVSERAEMLQRVLAPLQSDSDRDAEENSNLDAELVGDFLALGTCHLQLELLTRHMHHFTNLDEVYLQREAVAAAQAAVAFDGTAARSHLRTCFEILLEARERFYPIDCYLLDFCLLTPRDANEHFDCALAAQHAVNYLATARDLEQIAGDRPDSFAVLKEKWAERLAEVIGGEYAERPTPLIPLESLLFELLRGHSGFRRLFGRTPTTWARRRYGFATLLPQILSRSGYHSALHIALDDGLYPEEEQSKIRWDGCDNSVIDAASRIPLAADSACSFLRFPQRMAETMEQDQVAALILARWPEVKSPWFDDLCRMHKYAAALGRFVTFDDFFQNTDDPGRLSTFEEREYLSPFLIHSVAKQESDPISRYARHFHRRAQFDAASMLSGLSKVLLGKPAEMESLSQLEQKIEDAGPEGGDADQTDSLDQELRDLQSTAAAALAEVVMSGAGQQAGMLILNPLGFSRRVSVDLPQFHAPPTVSGPVKGVQFDDQRQLAVVEIPGSGFAWIPDGGNTSSSPPPPSASMIEGNILRNEYFELHINEETGGIARIKEHGRHPNRLSHQLAFRFPRERTIALGDGPDAERIKTAYSEMRGTSVTITAAGPTMAEAVTTGDIIDQQHNTRLAGFRNVYRIWRHRPVVEIEIELDVDRMPDGDPWSNYIAARFAWNDSTAALTRSVLGGAHSFRGERFESPHYFEIADGEERTTIVFHGRPFHRKTGPRMVDAILLAEGETERRFRFTIGVDQSYPLETALDAMQPVVSVPTPAGPPRFGQTGWFFHLEQRNVQITRILDLMDEPGEIGISIETEAVDTAPPTSGFALRLVETEGRHRRVKLRCFRAPQYARQRDFHGKTLTRLAVEDDAVVVEMSAYEIADVEVRFG